MKPNDSAFRHHSDQGGLSLRHSRRQFAATVLGTAAGLTVLSRNGLLGSPQSQESTERFFAAIRAGDLEQVKGLLDSDPRLASVTEANGLTAYAAALTSRQSEIALLIRERGYRPDAHESAAALDWELLDELAPQAPGSLNRYHPIGGSAMYAAALGGAGSSMWHVYRFGVDPSRAFADSPLGSPLQAALLHPHLPTAELSAAALLSNGVDPNPAPNRRPSPLHLAARRGSRDIVEMLIGKRAALGSKDADGRTPLECAEAMGNQEAARMLRSPEEIPRQHYASRRAFDADGNAYRPSDLNAFAVLTREKVVGVSHTNLDDLRSLVERYPDLVHCVAATTEGAVEAGAHMGRHDIVDYLLGKGAAYSLPTAVMRNDSKRVKELLDQEPDRIHERGAHDFALLWYPIIGRGDVSLMDELLRRGAQVERQHFLGTTALHYAARSGRIEMAELLIQHGADVNRVGRKFGGAEAAPLDFAEGKMAQFLRDHGAKPRAM